MQHVLRDYRARRAPVKPARLRRCKSETNASSRVTTPVSPLCSSSEKESRGIPKTSLNRAMVGWTTVDGIQAKGLTCTTPSKPDSTACSICPTELASSPPQQYCSTPSQRHGPPPCYHFQAGNHGVRAIYEQSRKEQRARPFHRDDEQCRN